MTPYRKNVVLYGKNYCVTSATMDECLKKQCDGMRKKSIFALVETMVS